MIRFIVFVLALPAFLSGQSLVRDTYTKEAFRDAVPNSWIITPAGESFVVVQSTSSPDTFSTKEFTTNFGGGDIYLNFRIVNLASGTLNVKLEVGLYRGPGIAENGWEWQTLGSFTAVGESDFVLKNYAFVADKPFTKYKYRVSESGAQSVQYVLNNHHFWHSTR